MISRSNFRIRVRATEAFKQLNVKPFELDHIPTKGEEFDVTIDRYYVLSGNNKYNKAFVTRISKVKLAELNQKINDTEEFSFVIPAEDDIKLEEVKPKKRGRKKKE